MERPHLPQEPFKLPLQVQVEHLHHGQQRLDEIVAGWLTSGESEEWEQLVNHLSAEDFILGQYVLHMTDRTEDVGMKSLIAGTALVIYAAMQAATGHG